MTRGSAKDEPYMINGLPYPRPTMPVHNFISFLAESPVGDSAKT